VAKGMVVGKVKGGGDLIVGGGDGGVSNKVPSAVGRDMEGGRASGRSSPVPGASSGTEESLSGKKS